MAIRLDVLLRPHGGIVRSPAHIFAQVKLPGCVRGAEHAVWKSWDIGGIGRDEASRALINNMSGNPAVKGPQRNFEELDIMSPGKNK